MKIINILFFANPSNNFVIITFRVVLECIVIPILYFRTKCHDLLTNNRMVTEVLFR